MRKACKGNLLVFFENRNRTKKFSPAFTAQSQMYNNETNIDTILKMERMRKSMLNWIYYPLSEKPTKLAVEVVDVFETHYDQIKSESHVGLKSDDVLKIVADSLSEIGFRVERGKKADEKVKVPVLFGSNGKPQKTFEVDAYYPDYDFVVEIEAGRGYMNNHFLRDIFEACMMHDVRYLAIAIRNDYRGHKDYERTNLYLETLYASNRLKLPLDGLLLIGY